MLKRLTLAAILALALAGSLSACTSPNASSNLLPATQHRHAQDTGGGVPGGH